MSDPLAPPAGEAAPNAPARPPHAAVFTAFAEMLAAMLAPPQRRRRRRSRR